MSTGDWIVLGIVAVCVALAIFFLHRQKKQGGTCNGCCGSCKKSCKRE